MNPTVKQLWLEALESGEYGKTQCHLKDSFGYCCLGVLADLYRKETGEGEWDEDNDFRLDENDYYSEFPPTEVCEWAGLETSTESTQPFTTEKGLRDSLVNLNDTSDTFDPVIAAIKAYF